VRGLGRLGIFTMFGGWRLAEAGKVSGEVFIYMAFPGEDVGFCRFLRVRFVSSFRI
jgi:hypothetical protein